MASSRLRRLGLACCTAAATLVPALPAHAVGRLVDVEVIDRDSGAALPVYRHGGEWWIAGRPGARYAIQVRNTSGAQVMGVMSVDGVNVITGDTASWAQNGYVFARGQSARIAGWRKSDSEVAAFHFTALPQSYAARTGRPDHVGVIGVAVFREKFVAPAPPLALPAPAQPEAQAKAGEPGDRRASADAAAAASRESSTAAGRMAPPAAPRLGTGHGERETSWVTHTRFERRSSQPDELITLRYDSRDNLVALGIVPPHPALPARPDAFPESPSARYTPDPPAWR